jgi:hypothetical protein
MSPEPFVRVRLQGGLAARAGGLRRLICGCGLGCSRLLVLCGTLLRKSRKRKREGQKQRYGDAIFHFDFLQIGGALGLHSKHA